MLRLAGGARDWRLLNDAWHLDERFVTRSYQPVEIDPQALPPNDPILRLTTPERRILLVQLVAEYAEGGLLFPSDGELARYFGISASQVFYDFAALIGTRRVESRIGSDGRRTTRRVLRIPGCIDSTADPGDA